MKKRGLIIAPSFELDHQGKASTWSNLDLSLVRKHLLYWDYIEYPEEATLVRQSTRLDNDIKTLVDQGILKNTQGYLLEKAGDQWILQTALLRPREFVTIAQFYAALKYQNSDVLWSVSQPVHNTISSPANLSGFVFVESSGAHSGKTLILKEGVEIEFVRSPALNIELPNILRIPAADVPIDTILNFKEKRKDELLRFRHALDKMENDIIESSDSYRALESAKDELDLATRDVHQILNESRINTDFKSILLKISIPKLIAGSISGVLLGNMTSYQFDLPHTTALVGSILGAAYSAGVDIKIGDLIKPRQIPDNPVRRLIYYAERDLG